MIPHHDQHLLEELKDKDTIISERALRHIYADCFDLIKSFILKNNGTVLDAEDIYQEAMMVFYEQMRKNELTLNCSIKTYVYSVSRNLWLKRLRQSKKEVELQDEHEIIPVEAEQLLLLEAEEKTRIIGELFEALGIECQRVLSLYYFERQRMKNIAEMMNFKNDQIAKNKKSRCMKNLREMVLKNVFLSNYFSKK